MSDNDDFNEDFTRIIGLYNQYYQLQKLQFNQIFHQMNLHKQEILRYCQKIYGFYNKFQGLFPHQNKKLMKQAAKHQWVKIFVNNFKMQYKFHEDYITYIIYHKISVPVYEGKGVDIFFDFQDKVFQQIKLINEQFAMKLQEFHWDSEFQIPLQLENISLYSQLIDSLNNDISEVLTEQQQIDIKNYMRIVFSQIIETQFETIKEQIQIFYKDFMSNTELEPSQLPQDFSYNNFGTDLIVEKPIYLKQNPIQQIQQNQEINKLQIGTYSIQIKKSIIILEITKDNKCAYIINWFSHYNSPLLSQLNDFQIKKIRTVKLSIDEAYTLVLFLKNNSYYLDQNIQIIEIYEQQKFDEINNQIQAQIEKHSKFQQEFQKQISKILPNSNNYKDIYSQKYITELQQQRKFDFVQIPIQECDFSKINFSSEMQGSILVDKQKSLCGVIIQSNINQMILFLKNTLIYEDYIQKQFKNRYQDIQILINKSKSNPSSLDKTDVLLKIQNKKEHQKLIIINETNIKGVSSEVAQFYVSLLLSQPTKNLLKNIKDFLELKQDVWINILKLLE